MIINRNFTIKLESSDGIDAVIVFKRPRQNELFEKQFNFEKKPNSLIPIDDYYSWVASHVVSVENLSYDDGEVITVEDIKMRSMDTSIMSAIIEAFNQVVFKKHSQEKKTIQADS